MELSEVVPGERVVDMDMPNGKATGIKVGLLSVHDDKLKRLRRKFQDARNHLEARGKTFSAEQIEENQSELNFAAMTSLDWGTDPETGEPNTFQGRVPELTKKDVFAIFEKLSWFKRKITNEISDEASFFKASATN